MIFMIKCNECFRFKCIIFYIIVCKLASILSSKKQQKLYKLQSLSIISKQILGVFTYFKKISNYSISKIDVNR